jgi:extradiol dioxygenase family protein
MTEGIKTFIYPVKDLAKAKTLYSEILGVEPYMDEPYYVGFDVEGQDVGLDPHGPRRARSSPPRSPRVCPPWTRRCGGGRVSSRQRGPSRRR